MIVHNQDFRINFFDFMDLSEQWYINGSGKIILSARLMEKVIKLRDSFNFKVYIIKNNLLL